MAFGTSQQIAVVPAPTPARHDAQAVGRIAERRQECELIADYERTVAHILNKIDHGRLDTAVALASIPETIRGYGPVKEHSIVQARAKQKKLMAAFDRPPVATSRELHTA